MSHPTTVSFTVNTGSTPAFTLTASPASLSVLQGSSGSSTVTTTVSGGFNFAIGLSVSGLPSGAIAVSTPPSIAASGAGTSILNITVGSSTAAGVYTVSVTGSDGGLTHNTGLTLTVTAAGGGTQLISDGGFESATSSGNSAPGWTATTNISGRSVIAYHGSYPHAGTNYASLGGSNNETDTLTQSIALPAGTVSAALTFRVSISTQETGTTAYDFLYVEIHNSSGALLVTPLSLSNLNASSDGNTRGTYFQPQSADLGAYAGQTIELVFRAVTDYTQATTFLTDDVSLPAH